MTWPHQKQNEYHKLVVGIVSCVINIPDLEHVRGFGRIAASSPNLGTTGRWGEGGAISTFRIEGWVDIARIKKKNVPVPRIDRWLLYL